ATLAISSRGARRVLVGVQNGPVPSPLSSVAGGQVGGAKMRLLSVIGLLAIVIGIAALVFFFGGFLNVAAMNPEPGPVKWTLIKVRMAAVDPHATDRPPSGYDTPAEVQAGAKAYMARGCTNCHGGPG